MYYWDDLTDLPLSLQAEKSFVYSRILKIKLMSWWEFMSLIHDKDFFDVSPGRSYPSKR